MNIEIVASSPRKESVTFREALFLKNYLATKSTHKTDIIDVRDWNFPALQQSVFSSVEKTPDDLKPLTERIFSADAFIIVTPEYNGSYTPAMKNMFDHYPKQMHKAFGIVTASPGALGGIRASQQLQLMINALFGIASPVMLVTPHIEKKFTAGGELLDGAFENQVHNFVTEFLWLAERLKHN